ncbi:MAG: hypothetical protein WC853_13375 [Thermodesulfovibrionales bacterium]
MTDFDQTLKERQEDLDLLRQNGLLDEGSFITFANDHGIPVSGVITGDPGDFFKRNWLSSDGTNHRGGLLFHPFRLLTLRKILEACKINIATSSTLQRDSVVKLVEHVISLMQSDEQIGERARHWDGVANLAILLEPIYWPRITSRFSRPGGMEESEHKALLDKYRQKVLPLVGSIDPALWHRVHESLRVDAAFMDGNDGLYLMLRLCNWSRREKLKGSIAGALWLRHIAEVIRRAFEETTTERWPEEDVAFGMWRPGGRTLQYGSERPLDDELKCKPYLALHHGLFTGSVVRWYVEGETEYYAILHVIPEPSKAGIELANLHGNIETGKANVALKLRDSLKEDKALRRFSMLSFDKDVAANVKSVRRQVEQKNIVGFIAAHSPDFEFSNFTIEELAEVAARIDEANGVSGKAVRNANWTGIASGRAFEARYVEVSDRKPRAIKGKEWGEALAAYALDQPNRQDNGAERPFWREIRAAIQGRVAHYDFQKDHFVFNPDTFELIGLTP